MTNSSMLHRFLRTSRALAIVVLAVAGAFAPVRPAAAAPQDADAVMQIPEE